MRHENTDPWRKVVKLMYTNTNIVELLECGHSYVPVGRQENAKKRRCHLCRNKVSDGEIK